MTARNNRSRLGLERLEDRWTPSAMLGHFSPQFSAPHSDLYVPTAARGIAAERLSWDPPIPAARVRVLHTYGTSEAAEVANTIPVAASKLRPLLPAKYELAPAAELGIGGWDQGVLAIANFRGLNPVIDHRAYGKRDQVAIVVQEPAAAALAGVDIPGAFHLYTLAIYTNDSHYAASLRLADMPVEFVPKITYDRRIDDASGVGQLTVGVPSKRSPFYSSNVGLGYAPAGELNSVFWHDSKKGTAVLHFRDEPFQQGQALSQVYTKPGSRLGNLLEGGGSGQGVPDPITGYESVVSPSLNFRYGEGTTGQLMMLNRRDPADSRAVNDRRAPRPTAPSRTVTIDRQAILAAGTSEPRRQAHSSVMHGATVAVLSFNGPDLLGVSLADGPRQQGPGWAPRGWRAPS